MNTYSVDEQRLVDTFCHLVTIDAATGNERKIADELTARLKALGAAVREDDAGAAIGGNTGNIIALFTGDKPDVPAIMLSAHMDRVEPGQGIRPRIENGIIRSSGDTILAADDLAGAAAILEALTVIKEQKISHGPIEVVFTIAEEGGLNGAKGLDVSQLQAKMGFIFDGGGKVGDLTVQAPAQTSLKATFKGKAAHAGVEPEKGINALKAAAIAIAEMNLGRIDEETTANIGIISAGRATNIVPDEAVIKGEARSRNQEKLKKQVDHMVSAIHAACARTGASVDLQLEDSYPAFRLTEADPVVQTFQAACRAIGLSANLVGSGGGSDANILNGKGLPSVVLGMGYEAVHTTSEYMPIGELRRAAELALAIIQAV